MRYFVRSLKSLCVLGILLTAILINPAPAKASEADYVKKFCDGQVEVTLFDNTRADCITSSEVIEFDFAYKYYEAIGQALHYGLFTDKQPGIYLILTSHKDFKYLFALAEVVSYYHLPINIHYIYQDFLYSLPTFQE